MDQETQTAWEVADKLERLLDNGRNALLIAHPQMTALEFRAALIAVTAKLLVRAGPLSLDIEAQAEIVHRTVLREMRRERGRQRGVDDVTRLMTEYTGPDVA